VVVRCSATSTKDSPRSNDKADQASVSYPSKTLCPSNNKKNTHVYTYGLCVLHNISCVFAYQLLHLVAAPVFISVQTYTPVTPGSGCGAPLGRSGCPRTPAKAQFGHPAIRSPRQEEGAKTKDKWAPGTRERGIGGYRQGPRTDNRPVSLLPRLWRNDNLYSQVQGTIIVVSCKINIHSFHTFCEGSAEAHTSLQVSCHPQSSFTWCAVAAAQALQAWSPKSWGG
jgi:hypothetical protein